MNARRIEMIENNESYIAIVIAAGQSERMGSFKPLLDLGGRPALFHLIDSILASGIGTIIVVTGHENKAVEDALGLYTSSCAFLSKNDAENTIYRLSTINNKDYKTGMFSSVKTGIKRVSEMLKNTGLPANSHKASLLFLADVPLVSSKTINGLIRKYEDFLLSTRFVDKRNASEAGLSLSQVDVKTEPFAVPVFEGKNGHPLLIPKCHYDEILRYTGEGGLKAIRNNYGDSMIRYETSDQGCVLDMDTQDDYLALQNYLKTIEDLEKSKDG